MENIQTLSEAAVKMITLIKHLTSLWNAPTVTPRLKKETMVRLRNFFVEAPLVLADAAMLIKHPKLVDSDAMKNIIADVTQMNTSAMDITTEIKTIFDKN